MSSDIKAVAYYRMSSDKQETSIYDQRTAVEKFAVDHGYNIVREYRDEGISGWKSGEQRHGFQKLIADAERREFQAVLCWDQDRFSRFPVLEANHYWYLLDRAGIHITTVAQGRLHFEDLGEWLKASVVQHGKAEYLRDLGRNTARGLLKLKMDGRWLSCAPIGYRLENGRLQLGDESDVATIRTIFDLRSRGTGCYSIAKTLNTTNARTPRGGSWHPVSVLHVLKNTAYIGNTVLGDKARGKYARVLESTITFENTHPAIVDRKTWQTVQSMWSTDRRAHTRNGQDGAALAGLLRCGRCGEVMYACSKNKYMCGTYHTASGCGHCTVAREPMLAAVAAKLREHVLMGSMARLEAAIQRQLDQRRTPKVEAEVTRRKLATLDNQIERAADRMLTVDDSLVGDLEQRLLGLKRQREQLAATMEESPTPKRQPSAKAIASKIWELDRVLREASPATVRHALSQLVDHIRLEFQPVKTNYVGQSYRFTGGMIQLRSQAVQQGTAFIRLGTAQRIALTPEDLAA